MDEFPNKTQHILRLKQVVLRTGISRSAVYQKLDVKSPHADPTFPRQIKLGASSVGWLESDVENWIESRIQASRNLFHAKK